jgi:type IV pilus assembly protein PilA
MFLNVHRTVTGEISMKTKLQTAQRGFTMIELIVVIAIMALLSILAIPFARGVIIDGKVGPTGADISKIATKIRTNMAGQGTTPYVGLGATGPATAVFANTARSLASTLTVTGAGTTATLTHDLGATGSQVTVAQGTITTAGDSFDVTLPTVNESACPSLASQLSKATEVITINGTSVKAAGGTYDGGKAQNLCKVGDDNTFVFTFR